MRGPFGWIATLLGGRSEKVQRRLAGANIRLKTEELGVIELVKEEEARFNDIWKMTMKERGELLAEVNLTGNMMSDLESVRNDLVKLEDLARRIGGSIDPHDTATSIKHVGERFEGHLAAEATVTLAELREGFELGAIVEKKLRALSSLANKAVGDGRFTETTAKRISRFVRDMRKRMNNIKGRVLRAKDDAEIVKIEAEIKKRKAA